MTAHKIRDLIDLGKTDKKVVVAQQAPRGLSGAKIQRVPAATPVRRPLFGR